MLISLRRTLSTHIRTYSPNSIFLKLCHIWKALDVCVCNKCCHCSNDGYKKFEQHTIWHIVKGFDGCWKDISNRQKEGPIFSVIPGFRAHYYGRGFDVLHRGPENFPKFAESFKIPWIRCTSLSLATQSNGAQLWRRRKKQAKKHLLQTYNLK